MIDNWTLPFLWVANGFLALLWMISEHIPLVLLVATLVFIYIQFPNLVGGVYTRAMRPAFLIVGALAILACVLSPMPVPWLMVAMIALGAVAVRLESFRPDAAAWSLVQGISLYSLVGLGAAAYNFYLYSTPPNPNDALLMGRSYAGILIAVATIGTPIGTLSMLVKNLLAHPPLPGGTPANMLDSVRSRNTPRR